MSIGKIPSQITELNFNIVWAQVDRNSRSAFIGIPKKVKLPVNFMLYKFTDRPVTGDRISAWWSPVTPYDSDPGLLSILNLARHLGASPADLTRVMAAVKENWNALTHLLEARLLMPVYGFWGQCSMQKRIDEGESAKPGIPRPAPRMDLSFRPTGNLPGYSWQLYIPNLTHRHIKQTSFRPVEKISRNYAI
ncbi:MAG TPA: hypothetical protein VK207_12555 [Bacteroidales bacterium]|nr:hypothetical protein [Bacteroidales bacterium]